MPDRIAPLDGDRRRLAGARHPWCQPGDQPVRRFVVWFDDPDQGVALFDNELEAREYYERATVAWNCYLLATLPREPGLSADPGYIPMPRNADEAKAMWLLGERWIRDNAPEMIRPASTEGRETDGGGRAPDGDGLLPSGPNPSVSVLPDGDPSRGLHNCSAPAEWGRDAASYAEPQVRE